LSLNKPQIAKLNRIISLAKQLLADDRKTQWDRRDDGGANGRRIRRTGKELVEFRKMLKAERGKGVSVATLARKHGISSAYIYMLP
jgi:hypothetical protein